MAGLTIGGVFVNILGSGLLRGEAEGADDVTPTPASGRQGQVTNLPPKGYNWEDHLYAYLIDTTKCIGCGMCVRACKNENDVPDGFYRTWIEEYLIATNDHGDFDVQVFSPNGGLFGFQASQSPLAVSKGFFVPKMCNHCDNTPCTQVCPVGASYQTKDGVVLVDKEQCIGCGYCIQACPYGSRFLDPVSHTASKCTWCYHRITRGLRPACVAACPTGTRVFGDLKRTDDPVLVALSKTRVQVLQPNLLTKPRCYYVGLDLEVR
ncbi:MAG: 4Fe-4S dicluster domain-containing protein [Candidatus Schekmanbacteria bacterium]|nr:4Fe-4S dicluster domain-containing protein [Candidatus Schekmanbacteria bacterium]